MLFVFPDRNYRAYHNFLDQCGRYRKLKKNYAAQRSLQLTSLLPQLAGKVKVPECAASLQKALLDAETGKAQRMKGLELEFEEPLTELIEHIELEDGEILRLPPTPNQTIAEEAEEERRLREEGKFEDIKV